MENNYLAHHGILGMKWGVRRYQNEDGSLTPAGRERYQKGLAKEVAGKMQKRESIYDSDVTRNIASKSNTLSKLVKSYKEAGQYANSVINRANKDSVYAKTISEKVKNRWLDRYKAEGKSEQELADEKKYWESGEWLGSMDDTNAVLLSDKEYSKIVDSQTKLQNEWEEEYPKLVNDALGKHGSEKVKIQPEYGKAYNDTVSDYVNGQLRYLGIDLSADKDLEEKILGHSLDSDDHLEHHGILGMKWGVRRYQNEDGSLTPAGRERYQKGLAKELKETYKKHGPLAPISADAKNLAENSKVFRRYKETYAAPDNFLKSRREQLKSDKEYAKKYAKRYFEHERDLAKKSANSQEALDKMISIIDQDEKSVSWAKDSHLADEVIFFNEGDKYDKLIDENIKAAREWSKEHRRIAKDALGKYGDVKLRAKWDNKKYKTTASNFLKFALNYADVDPSINNGMDYSKLVHALFSDEDDDHLEHHGILGMKWYHRRFQNEDGSLTPAGRERYGVGEAREGSSDKPKKPGIVERHKQKKEEKRKAAEKAARVKRMQEGKAKKAEERKAAEEHEAAKQKALRSAKASEIMKYRDELTDQEMRDAVARIGWDEALRKKAKEENPDKLTKAMKVVDKYGKAAGSIATATENTTKMYNNIAKALNTFTGSDWPLVGEKRPTQNEIIRDNEQTKQAQIKTATDREKLKQERKRTEGFIDPSELQNQNNQNDNSGSDKPNNKPNNDKGPSKKDKENFEKAVKEGAKILGEAAKKVNEESKKQAEEKHDRTVNDKPASNASSSSSSNDKSVFDTKSEYSDAKAERAEQIGRDAVERYLQLEDKRKG